MQLSEGTWERVGAEDSITFLPYTTGPLELMWLPSSFKCDPTQYTQYSTKPSDGESAACNFHSL